MCANGAKNLTGPVRKLYDEDFALWASETARLLRMRRFAEIDFEDVAEEIEQLSRSDQRELLSRLTILILHLLKWTLQPDKRSMSWRLTIANQREELRRLFRQSPSLRGTLAEAIEEVYLDSVEKASIETGLEILEFPGRCPFAADEIPLGSFLPS